MADFVLVGKSRFVVIAVLQTIYSSRRAGCVVFGDEETRSFRWSTMCRRHVEIRFDGSDDQRFLDCVNAMAAENPDLVLIPCDCDGIRLTDRVKHRLKVRTTPIPQAATLEMFDDKWRFYEFCRQHELPTPDTFFVGEKAALDFDVIVSRLGLPFMLKPANQAGSIGVQVVRSRQHFEEAICRNPEYRFGRLIAQRYIDGVDIDLSLLAVQGEVRAFAIQKNDGVEINFVPHAQLETLAALVPRLSNYHGLMHIDARIDRKTGALYLIECNPRFWASLTEAAWCGLDFVQATLQAERLANEKARVAGLTQGTAYTRHPLIRPASWPLLLAPGVRGRLMRAMMLDPYSVKTFLSLLPEIAWRYANKRAFSGVRRLRPRKAAL
ncbi:ATP-grasp domain-containing protein [Noviherbaspirillum humi]|uniref:ATP-grasp domain-containing protein n=1 Tax=Noviherbaspirillum humi TaxID=1688639 RepID=A0A239KT80_9BURK|nr:ATP-grasp domain-containing protein [Noviherbaspirillum humi]SNT20434.1 ATP-grasp domain-containing protein [Noviherbaspirillum humi]